MASPYEKRLTSEAKDFRIRMVDKLFSYFTYEHFYLTDGTRTFIHELAHTFAANVKFLLVDFQKLNEGNIA